MVLSGQSPDGRLVEIVELRDHPWFVASQFHPEFRSRPDRPHPLFSAFVAAAVKQAEATPVGRVETTAFAVNGVGVAFRDLEQTAGGEATAIAAPGDLPA